MLFVDGCVVGVLGRIGHVSSRALDAVADGARVASVAWLFKILALARYDCYRNDARLLFEFVFVGFVDLW